MIFIHQIRIYLADQDEEAFKKDRKAKDAIIFIHEYFGINLPIVWDVVQGKLGPLESSCRRLMERVAEQPDQETLLHF
jgi:uncharacterized protein with HEPN domain